jgi:hypothetical protein
MRSLASRRAAGSTTKVIAVRPAIVDVAIVVR